MRVSSVLRYFAADIQNAYGPNVRPRTGEILESHIGWYHNMSLLRIGILQTAAVDPSARKTI
jgi:hypothetical protein